MLKTLGVQLRASMPVPRKRGVVTATIIFSLSPNCLTQLSFTLIKHIRDVTEGLLPTALSLKFFKLCAFRTAFPTACRGGARSSRCTKQFRSDNPRKITTIPRLVPLSWRPSKKGSCHGYNNFFAFTKLFSSTIFYTS